MAAKIIGVVNQKGGSSKTTTSVHLACGLKSRGRRVVLIDNDPQRGSMNWKRLSNGSDHFPSFIGIENPISKSDVELFINNVDYIIVDGAPGLGNDPRLRECHDYLNELVVRSEIPDSICSEIKEKLRYIFGFDGTISAKLTSIIALADFLVLPTSSSVPDLQPTSNIVNELIAPHKGIHNKPEYRVLLADTSNTTNLYRESVRFFETAKIPMFDTLITHREIYKKAASAGFTVIQDKTDAAATAETEKVTSEILEFFEKGDSSDES